MIQARGVYLNAWGQWALNYSDFASSHLAMNDWDIGIWIIQMLRWWALVGRLKRWILNNSGVGFWTIQTMRFEWCKHVYSNNWVRWVGFEWFNVLLVLNGSNIRHLFINWTIQAHVRNVFQTINQNAWRWIWLKRWHLNDSNTLGIARFKHVFANHPKRLAHGSNDW